MPRSATAWSANRIRAGLSNAALPWPQRRNAAAAPRAATNAVQVRTMPRGNGSPCIASQPSARRGLGARRARARRLRGALGLVLRRALDEQLVGLEPAVLERA